MLSDLRFALRSLLKTPGFTTVAVLTLSLGIGAITAVFSMLDHLLLRPLPYPNADRLVVPLSVNPERRFDIPRITTADYQDWQREKVFERLALVDTFGGEERHLSDETGETQRARMIAVTRDYFAVLGVSKALLGRTFRAEEHYLSMDAVQPCVISYGLWQRRYGGDTEILGRSIRVNGYPCPVVGVMPKGALWPADTDIVQPRQQHRLDSLIPKPNLRRSDFLVFSGLAQLKTGQSVEQTSTVLAAIAKRTELQYPQQRQGWSNRVASLREAIVGQRLRMSLWTSMAAVFCVLLIAAINVAGLLLARAITRRHEIQVRAALGANHWQLSRHLLAESGLLALLGGVLGLLLAVCALKLLGALSLPGMPTLPSIQVSPRVVSFAVGVSMFTALICGLAPLLHTLRSGLKPTHVGASEHGGRRGTRMLNGLVVSEIALSVVLLIGAGLLIRSFLVTQRIDPGFQTERLLAITVSVPSWRGHAAPTASQYDSELVLSLYRDLLQRTRNAPGVLSVSISSALPLSGGGDYSSLFLAVEGRPGPPAGPEYPVMASSVSADFFDTLGMQRIAGRDFDSSDTQDSRPVIIVNQALARRVFPNENPLGKRILVGIVPAYREIVGVVSDVRYLGREDELRALAYVPHTQEVSRSMMLVIRTLADPSAMAASLRNEVKNIHPGIVMSDAKTMAQILDRSVAPRRSSMALLTILAGVALVLAAIGIYGVLSYKVTQRAREVGVRMALGADAKNILGMVIGQGMRLTLLGVALGLVAAFALTHLMNSLLYGVSAIDPATFVFVTIFLTGVALAASYLPARRATRVSPMVALRTE